MLNRTWPSELQPYLNQPNAVEMMPGEELRICPNCGGWGIMLIYVTKGGPYQTPDGGKVKWLDMPDGKSGWYTGEMKISNCPACRGGQMQAYLERNCGLTGRDLAVSLQDFMTNGAFEDKAEAKMVAGNLLAMNRLPVGFVTFWGGYGRGKTHLLKALVNGFRRINVVAQYRMMSDLLAEIREKFGDERGAVSAEQVIESFRGVQVLCVDEINQVNMTPWALETMNRLLDSRYTQREERLTVMALNAQPDKLPIDFAYLASRMSEGLIVEVRGGDVREALSTRFQ